MLERISFTAVSGRASPRRPRHHLIITILFLFLLLLLIIAIFIPIVLNVLILATIPLVGRLISNVGAGGGAAAAEREDGAEVEAGGGPRGGGVAGVAEEGPDVAGDEEVGGVDIGVAVEAQARLVRVAGHARRTSPA